MNPVKLTFWRAAINHMKIWNLNKTGVNCAKKQKTSNCLFFFFLSALTRDLWFFLKKRSIIECPYTYVLVFPCPLIRCLWHRINCTISSSHSLKLFSVFQIPHSLYYKICISSYICWCVLSTRKKDRHLE